MKPFPTTAPVHDLLTAGVVETASGDAGWNQPSPLCRAVWTGRIEGEEEAPERRIIHCRPVRLQREARLRRIGIRQARGYHKCGSRMELDWVRAFRVLAWDGSAWHVLRDERNIPAPPEGKLRWFDLGNAPARSVLIEVRQCGIDTWWPSWNLAAEAFVLEGSTDTLDTRGRERRNRVGDVVLNALPEGVTASRQGGELRYRTRFLQVGFSLGRAGFSFLAVDDEGMGRVDRNLLRSNPGVFLQGPRLHPVGGEQLIGPIVCNDVDGTTTVRDNIVSYRLELPNGAGTLLARWTVEEERLVCHVERLMPRPMRAWESNFWTIACHSEVTATSVLGCIVRAGETGAVALPALFHAPGHGTFLMECTGPITIRSDSFRPAKYTTLEFKLAETSQTEGDYLLPAGVINAELQLRVQRHHARVQADTPRAVQRALERCTYTALPYRPDTATLSNNGNSIHCPICMDTWSELALRIGPLLPSLNAVDLLRDSLERWLNEGPGYASGRMHVDGTIHYAEDEYLMTGTAALLGLALYLHSARSDDWIDAFHAQIALMIERMRGRDLDGDGLIESPYRLGISGQHQWSTNWYDVISFGWKDALSNALLYRALVLLDETLTTSRHAELATGLRSWAERLRASYLPAFYNPATGWLAGWRSKDGVLHDYAFLAVNGVAYTSGVVDEDVGREMLLRLWQEAGRIGLPEYRLGLPGNLREIPDEDLVDLMHGQAMGYYQNGGLTHAQARHFVDAMYRAGLREEADRILEGLCASLADGTAFGGCNSGVDWRYWDGWPCGYEGLLTDQFGILAVAMERYGTR